MEDFHIGTIRIDKMKASPSCTSLSHLVGHDAAKLAKTYACLSDTGKDNICWIHSKKT